MNDIWIKLNDKGIAEWQQFEEKEKMICFFLPFYLSSSCNVFNPIHQVLDIENKSQLKG